MTGEVKVTLDGRSEVLRPTLRAARTVNAMGGFTEVFRKLSVYDLEAFISVVAAGVNKRPSEVEEAVFKAGLADLIQPLSEYVGLLANGGRAIIPEVVGEKPPEGES